MIALVVALLFGGTAGAAGLNLTFSGGTNVANGTVCALLVVGDQCKYTNVVSGAGSGAFQRDAIITVVSFNGGASLGPTFDNDTVTYTDAAGAAVAGAHPEIFSPVVNAPATPNRVSWVEFRIQFYTPGTATLNPLNGTVYLTSFDTDSNSTTDANALREFVEFVGPSASGLASPTFQAAGTAVAGGSNFGVASSLNSAAGITNDPRYKVSGQYVNPGTITFEAGAVQGNTAGGCGAACARLGGYSFVSTDAVYLQPILDGYKSVKLTTDADGNGIASPGDTLTYTVTYANTGNAAETNFQIVDALPAGVTITAAGAQTVRLNGTVTAAARNATYTGAGTTTNLLGAGQTLPVNGTVSVDIPVKINAVAAATTTLANQTTTSGSYVNAAGATITDTSKPSDNVDTTTTFPPSVSSTTGFGTVPTGSLAQTQAATNDPTTVTVTRQTLNISKSFSPGAVQAGGVTSLTFTVTNPYTVATSALAVTDDLAGTMGLSRPLPLRVTANTCGGSITTGTGNTALTTNATAVESNDGILKLTGGSLAANSSCSVTVNVTVVDPTATTRTNTIPAANVTGTLNGQAITAAAPATATLTTTTSTAGGSYTCDARFYQLRQDPTTLLSNLYQLDRRNLAGGGTAQWSTGFGPGLNALAFNKADGYFYGVNITPFTTGNPYRLYRLGSSGAAEVTTANLGIPTGSTIAAATIDASGTMYIKKLTNDAVIYKYTIGTGATSTLTINGGTGINIFDLAFNPVDSFLYGVVTPGGVYRINASTGATTLLGIPAAGAADFSNYIGSAFFDVSGTLYAYQNGGTYGTISTATGAFTTLASASAASQSDGASCVFPDQKIDAVKSVGTVTANSTLSFDVPYTVTVKNTGTVSDPNVQLTENLSSTFSAGSPTLSIVSGPTVTGGTATPNASFNGSTNTSLLSGTDTLAAGASVTVTFTVRVVYPNAASVPSSSTTLNNTVYASTTSTGSNAGYTFSGGTAVPPVDLLATDMSTNGSTPPASANGDTATATPVTLPAVAQVTLNKTVVSRAAAGDQFTVQLKNGAAVTASGTTSGTGTTASTGAVTVLSGTAYTLTELMAAGTSPLTYYDTAVTCTNSTTGSVTTLPSGAGQSFTLTPAAGDVITCTLTNTARPDLTITKTHTGTWTKGDLARTYTLTVTNSGVTATSGTVTVVDTLPTGLSAVSIAGTGWTCVKSTLTCTRSDALAAGASYPVITVTVDVDTTTPTASTSVTNQATVSGGNEGNTTNDTASDVTPIAGAPGGTTGTCSAYANASPTNLNFSGAGTLVSGTANTAGAVYRFSNVATGVDALVTVNSVSATSATLLQGGLSANLTANGSASVEYRVDLVLTGTATPAAPVDVFLYSFDIDGLSTSNPLSDYAEYVGPNSVFYNSPTRLTLTSSTHGAQSSTYLGYNDPNGNDPRNALGAVYLDVNSFVLRAGFSGGTASASRGVTFDAKTSNSALFTQIACSDLTPRTTDLIINKAGPAVVTAGQTVTYTLTVTNNGLGKADGATFADTVPATLTGVTATCGTLSGGAAGCSASVSGSTVTGSITTFPRNAAVTVIVTGTVPANASGSISNTATVTAPATVSDTSTGNNTSNTVTTTINVPPTAVNDTSTTTAGTAKTFSITGNDTAPGTVNAASTVFAATGQPAGSTLSNGNRTITVPGEGSYTLDNAGNVTFTPAAGYSGTTTAVKYTVNDNQGATSNTATITVTVTPVATNDTATTAPSTLVNIPVLGNDLGSGKVLTSLLFPGAGQPTGSVVSNGGKTLTNADGVYTIKTDGTVDFTPALGKTGALSPVLYTFVDGAGQTSNTATITVTVSAITPPVAVNDSKTTPKNTAVTLEGSTNDTARTLPIDNASVILTAGGTITNAGKTLTNAEGTYQVQANGTVIFTPVSTFAGTTTPVSYTVKDTAGNVSNAATLSVTVTNQPPVANAVTNVLLTSTAPATALSAGLSGTDPDGTVVTYTITTLPTAAMGTLSCSGTAIASVPFPCAPANLTFKPNPAFNGNATFQYTVTDDNGATSAAATYTIPVNKPPVAVNDSGATNPLTSVTFSITGNDTDTAPGTLDLTSAVFDPSSTGTISNAGKTLVVAGEGTYTLDNSGNVTFLPVAGFNSGTSTARYTVKDNNGAISNVATISVAVPASVDLAIAKAGPAYFKPGDTLLYTLTVTNSGSAATGVTVTDTLPTGLIFGSASNSGSYNSGTGKVSWTVGNVASGATVTLTVTGTAPTAASIEAGSGPTSLLNSASVAANETEVVTNNNTATSTAQLVYPKLTKRVRNVTAAGTFGTTGTGKPGEVLEYCIDFKNYGVAVSGFVLSDTVPTNTTANLSAYGAGLGLQVTRGTVTTRTSTGSDADGGTLSASALSVDLGSLTAGESGGVCFQSSIK